MSLVWTTIVLLILLLPGFLFFVGLYSHERMSRDVAPGSALGQLSGVVLFAFVTHGALYLSLTWLCQVWSALPCISIQGLSATLQLAGSDDQAAASLDATFLSTGHWIFVYVIGTSVFGYLVGRIVARYVMDGPLRVIARHSWMYDLVAANKERGPVHAFVLTHIREGNRILMYRGFVKDFYFTPEGKIAYLALRAARRYYLILDDDGPTTSSPEQWKTIGATDDKMMTGMARLWSYLMIEGEDIANVVFNAYRSVGYSQEGEKSLDAYLQSVVKQRARVADQGANHGTPRSVRRRPKSRRD